MGFARNSNWPDEVFKGRPNSVAGTNMFANRIFYIPMPIFARHTFTLAKIRAGTSVGGNYDIGICDANFNFLWRRGSAAVAGTAVFYSITITPSLTLPPGKYYGALVFTVGGGTNQFLAAAVGNAAGFRIQDGVYPLPAVGTPLPLQAPQTPRDSVSGITIPLLTIR